MARAFPKRSDICILGKRLGVIRKGRSSEVDKKMCALPTDHKERQSRVQSDVCAQTSSRGVTVVPSVLSVGAMYTARYYEDREHEALCSAGEK